MDKMLCRIIYMSRSFVGLDDQALDALVISSSASNRRDGISGMLWTDGDSFAQVLEGPKWQLQTTMDRIRRDRRHTEIDVLFDELVRSRQFGNWAMRRGQDDIESDDATIFLIGFAVSRDDQRLMQLYRIVKKASDPANSTPRPAS